MAGPSSHTSVTDFEAFAESYLGMRSNPEGSCIHRSSRWESPASSSSPSSGSSFGNPFEDRWDVGDADDELYSDSVSSADLLPHEGDSRSPSLSELAREVEDLLNDEESPLTGYSYKDIGVPSMGGQPFIGDDWAEMVEEESLQARALKFNSPEFVRDFFEGKQQDSIATRRGIAIPPLLPTVSPVQSPALSSVQSSALSSAAQTSAALSWLSPSPTRTTSRSPVSPAQSLVFESPRLYKSPEHASFGDGPYTQNLLLQVTRQLDRLMDALAEQQDEIDNVYTEPIVSSRYFRQQLLAFNKRLTALEEKEAAREEASKKPEVKPQQSIRFAGEASSKSPQQVKKQHRVYPKEKWPSARDNKVSIDWTSRATKHVTFERQASQGMATERVKYPKETHPRAIQSPINASSNKKKSVAHPLSRAAQSENADDSRLKSRPTVATKLVTVVGKTAITVIAAVCFHGMLKKLC